MKLQNSVVVRGKMLSHVLTDILANRYQCLFPITLMKQLLVKCDISRNALPISSIILILHTFRTQMKHVSHISGNIALMICEDLITETGQNKYHLSGSLDSLHEERLNPCKMGFNPHEVRLNHTSRWNIGKLEKV